MPNSVSHENLARLVLAQRFIKLFQSAILLNVNQPKKIKEAQREKGPVMTKSVEECAYAKMIEDFIMKYAFHDKSNLYLMKLVPSLLHTGFVSAKTQAAITKSLEDFITNSAEEKKELDGNANDHLMQQPKMFTDVEMTFLRDHCIKSIKAKSVSAQESSKVFFAFKKDEPNDSREEAKNEENKENQENMMEVDNVRPESQDESNNIQIDTTKSMDAMIGAMGKKRKKPLQGDVEMQEENKQDATDKRQGAKGRKERKVR